MHRQLRGELDHLLFLFVVTGGFPGLVIEFFLFIVHAQESGEEYLAAVGTKDKLLLVVCNIEAGLLYLCRSHP